MNMLKIMTKQKDMNMLNWCLRDAISKKEYENQSMPLKGIQE